jgi:hypothetical protein
MERQKWMVIDQNARLALRSARLHGPGPTQHTPTQRNPADSLHGQKQRVFDGSRSILS